MTRSIRSSLVAAGSGLAALLFAGSVFAAYHVPGNNAVPWWANEIDCISTAGAGISNTCSSAKYYSVFVAYITSAKEASGTFQTYSDDSTSCRTAAYNWDNTYVNSSSWRETVAGTSNTVGFYTTPFYPASYLANSFVYAQCAVAHGQNLQAVHVNLASI